MRRFGRARACHRTVGAGQEGLLRALLAPEVLQTGTTTMLPRIGGAAASEAEGEVGGGSGPCPRPRQHDEVKGWRMWGRLQPKFRGPGHGDVRL